MHDGVAGEPVARLLTPDSEDYFVLKPANSGFFATPLEALLKLMGAQKLVITGVATDHCILFTAADAYVRNYELVIPRDCVAAVIANETDRALKYFKRVLKADVRPASRVMLRPVRGRRRN